MTDRTTTGTPADTTAAGAPGAHHPGQWPHTPNADELLTRMRQELARRAITLGTIRAHLEEQPNPWTVRACARNWVDDLLAIAETVAKNMEHPK